MTETPIVPIAEMTLDELRGPLIEALVTHVPFDGWSEAALARAATQLGIPPERARIVFPGGAVDMIAAYIARADAHMRAELQARGIDRLKIRERITLAVRVRLEQAEAHKEAIRRLLAVLAMPQNLPFAMRSLWSTADAMWRAAGDTATDYNHYTKRLTLSSVYGATLLVWLDDDSDGHAETWAFLDRRIADVMRFEKTKAQWRQSAERLPSLTRFLGRLRYPGV